MTTDAENLSTSYQPKGSGKNLSDTLDKGAESEPQSEAHHSADDPAEGSDSNNPPDEGSPKG